MDHSSDILQQQYFPTGLVRMSQEIDPGRHGFSFSLGSGSGRLLMSLHSLEHTWLVGVMGGGSRARHTQKVSGFLLALLKAVILFLRHPGHAEGPGQDSLMSAKIKGRGSNPIFPCGDHPAFVGEWHSHYGPDCM